MLYDKHGILHSLHVSSMFETINLRTTYLEEDVILDGDLFLRLRRNPLKKEPAKVRFILAEDEVRIFLTAENVTVQEDDLKVNEFRIDDAGRTLYTVIPLSVLKESPPKCVWEGFEYMQYVFRRALEKQCENPCI